MLIPAALGETDVYVHFFCFVSLNVGHEEEFIPDAIPVEVVELTENLVAVYFSPEKMTASEGKLLFCRFGIWR